MSDMLCAKCNVPLQKTLSKFSYLGHEFQSETPGCPVCGQIYLSEKLVEERIRRIEAAVEDK
jgi:uncharacterized protein with PIN domain